MSKSPNIFFPALGGTVLVLGLSYGVAKGLYNGTAFDPNAESTAAVSTTVETSAVADTTVASAMSDTDNGRKVYKKCSSCHMIGPDARNRVGPPMNDIVGAAAGAAAGFGYSDAFKAAADGGLVWTAENLNAFLENPAEFIPENKMSFKGISKEEDRVNLIAYMAQFSGAAIATAEVDEVYSVSAEILAIEGDMEYGEYLGNDCQACHQTSGDNDGIPGIIGWQTEDFVTALHAYREKVRENPVMQTVAGRLTDEEIASLAVYFKSLGE
ncbi:MAG: c-type cytochrome [Planktomarina sp.]